MYIFILFNSTFMYLAILYFNVCTISKNQNI